MIQRLMLARSGSGYIGCGEFYFYLEHIADYMALLNSSTNFVIYILFSPHFRHTLKTRVCIYRVIRYKAAKCADIELKKTNSLDNMDNALELAECHVSYNDVPRVNAQVVTDSEKQQFGGHRHEYYDTHLLSPLKPDGTARGNSDHHLMCSSNATSHESLATSHDGVGCDNYKITTEIYNNDHSGEGDRMMLARESYLQPCCDRYTPQEGADANIMYSHVQMDIPAIAIDQPSSANEYI